MTSTQTDRYGVVVGIRLKTADALELAKAAAATGQAPSVYARAVLLDRLARTAPSAPVAPPR